MPDVESSNALAYWEIISETAEELVRAYESGKWPTVYYKASQPRKAYHQREKRGAGIVVRCISVDVPRLRNTDHRPGHVSEAYIWDLAKWLARACRRTERRLSYTRTEIMRSTPDGKKWNAVRWHEARRIRAAREDGATVREIAARFRLHPNTVYKILRRAA